MMLRVMVVMMMVMIMHYTVGEDYEVDYDEGDDITLYDLK